MRSPEERLQEVRQYVCDHLADPASGRYDPSFAATLLALTGVDPLTYIRERKENQ